MSDFTIDKELESAIEKSFLKDSYEQYKNFKQNFSNYLQELLKTKIVLDTTFDENNPLLRYSVIVEQQLLSHPFVQNIKCKSIHYYISFDKLNKIFYFNSSIEKFGTDILFINYIHLIIKHLELNDVKEVVISNQTLPIIKKRISLYPLDFYIKLKKNVTVQIPENYKDRFCLSTKSYTKKTNIDKIFCIDLVTPISDDIFLPICIDENMHYHMWSSSFLYTAAKNFIYKCFIAVINKTKFGYLVASRTNINSQILIIKTLIKGEVNFKLYDDKVILWSKKYSLTNSDVEQLFKEWDFKDNPSTNILLETKL